MNTNSISLREDVSIVATVCAMLALSLFVPAFVKAEEVQQAPTGTTQAVKAVVVADVNVTNAVSTEKNGVITGSFALQGKLGQQNNIVYGIIVVDSQGQLLDLKKLGESDSVKEGEIRPIPISYTVPSFVKGKAQVLVVAETKGGLLLGAQPLADKEWNGTGATLQCTRTATTTVSCTPLADTTLSVTSRTALFGEEAVIDDSVVAKKGQPVTIDLSDLPPGPSYVFFTTDSGEKSVLRLTAPGEYGQIRNVVVERGQDGETVLRVAMRMRPITGTTLNYELKDKKGTVCDSGTRTNDAPAAEISVDSSCVTGSVSVKLLGTKNQLLASAAEPFSVLRYSVEGGKSTVKIITVMIITLAALLFLIVALRRWRGAGATTPPTAPPAVPPAVMGLFVVFAILSFGPRAEAFSISAYPLGVQEAGHICDGAVSTNKASYAPGEQMTVTGSFTLTRDAGAQGDGLCSVGYNSTEFDPSPIWDTPAPFGTSFVLVVGVLSGNYGYFSNSRQFNAPATAGAHYLAMRSIVVTYNGAGANLGSAQEYENMNFSVASTPTVQVWFGP